MNPTSNSGAPYSNPQYAAGYSAQPPPNTYPNQQYQMNYQSGTYPPAPPTNQAYGVYPPPTEGPYGGNQSAYPDTNKHFSGDIGFGF